MNPQAYALCIGINEFSNPSLKSLKNCIKDVDFWSRFFSVTCSYNVVRTLKNENATKDAVLIGLWCLAAHAQPGDIVAITISSHGSFVVSNSISTYDQSIRENEFLFFLRFFKPGVRVVVVTDTCQSGTFIDKNRNKTLYAKEISNLKSFFERKLPHAKRQMEEILDLCNDVPLTSYVAHFASSSDESDVNDGLLIRLTKSLSPLGLDWYELSEWRQTMQTKFREQLYNLPSMVNEIMVYYNKSEIVKNALEKLRLNSGHKSISSYLFFQLATLDETRALLKSIRFIGYSDSEDKEDQYQKTLNWVLNATIYNFESIPVLEFHGKKSVAFQKQYAFAKKSPAFQKEHQ